MRPSTPITRAARSNLAHLDRNYERRLLSSCRAGLPAGRAIKIPPTNPFSETPAASAPYYPCVRQAGLCIIISPGASQLWIRSGRAQTALLFARDSRPLEYAQFHLCFVSRGAGQPTRWDGFASEWGSKDSHHGWKIIFEKYWCMCVTLTSKVTIQGIIISPSTFWNIFNILLNVD